MLEKSTQHLLPATMKITSHCILHISYLPFCVRIIDFNPLTPNDHYSGRTAPLTSNRCILYIYSTNIVTEHFKHGIYSFFF